MNLNKFTKAELISFLEAERARQQKDRAAWWEASRDAKQALSDVEEELALCKGDEAERLGQRVAPLMAAIEEFPRALDIERYFGPLNAEAHTLVTDLFRHIAEASKTITTLIEA